MPTLTNFADHCDLINLGLTAGKSGPYALRQVGTAPGSTTLQQDPFFLRKDGVWVINLTVFSLPEKEIQEKFLFRDIPEMFSVIETLSGKPLVVEDKLPEGRSKEEILASIRTAANTLISRIRDSKGSRVER